MPQAAEALKGELSASDNCSTTGEFPRAEKVRRLLMSAEISVPAGWYDMAGDVPGIKRWWDGAHWTSAVQTPEPETPALTVVASGANTAHVQGGPLAAPSSAPADDRASKWGAAVAEYSENPARQLRSEQIAGNPGQGVGKGGAARAQREAAVTPFQWMFFPLRRYADFKSRACVAELWWFHLFLLAGYALAWFLSGALGAVVLNEPGEGPPPELGDYLLAFAPLLLFAAATVIPTVAVYHRRLHDTGRNGKRLMSIPSVIFGVIVLPMILPESLEVETEITSYTMSAISAAWILGVTWIGPADAGWNKYGQRHELPN